MSQLAMQIDRLIGRESPRSSPNSFMRQLSPLVSRLVLLALAIGCLRLTSASQTVAPKNSPPNANAQKLSSGHPTRKLGSISGRVFAVTKAGDLKPARFAHVYVFGDLPNPLHESAQTVFLQGTIDGENRLARWIKATDNYSEAVVCQKGLLIVDESLDKVAQWVEQNKMYSQLKGTDADEEGKFRVSGVASGTYTVVIRGRAGINDAYWQADVFVGLDGKVTEFAGGAATQVAEVKLGSPKEACLSIE
jgi:hypothetical protein